MIPNHNIEKWWFRLPATQSSWVKFAQVDACFLWHTPRVFQILYNSQLIPPNHQVATKFFFFRGWQKNPRVRPRPSWHQEWHSNYSCLLLLLTGVVAGVADVARLLYDRRCLILRMSETSFINGWKNLISNHPGTWNMAFFDAWEKLKENHFGM